MRADSFFAAKYGSRTRAKDALAKGSILRAGRALAPADEVREGDVFTFLDEEDYVSRGAYKLARGLQAFGADAAGCVFADLGASTGGFCDVLLRAGAARVYAVDVGSSQLDARLRADGRVVVMDGVNARYLTPADFPERLDGVVCDLSFISLRLVLPAVRGLLAEGGRAFVLFKPQFECGGKGLKKGGILPVKLHADLLKTFYDDCMALTLAPRDIVNAPLHPHKNVEYLVYLSCGDTPIAREEFLRRAANLV